MPRAAQQLATAAELIVTGPAGLDQTDDAPLAQRRALVRASIADGKILALDIEDPDLAALDR